MRQGGMQRLPEGRPAHGQRGLSGGAVAMTRKTARFIQIIQQALGPEGMATYINNTELIKRLSSSMGISPLGLVKSEQQIAAEMQQAQQAQLAQELLQPQSRVCCADCPGNEHTHRGNRWLTSFHLKPCPLATTPN